MKTISVPFAASFLAAALTAGAARADGTPPPDLGAAVGAPTSSAAAPPPIVVVAPDHMTTSIAAGGQGTTGNSTILTGSANGKFDFRSGDNGFGASIVANYAASAVTGAASNSLNPTMTNLQARIRYDRYVADWVSIFGIVTWRNDRFQGLQSRLNLDPGVKLLALHNKEATVWFEGGYDFQWDLRNWAGRLSPPTVSTTTTTGTDGSTTTTTTTTPVDGLLPYGATDHSARGFVGWKQIFTPSITFSTGLEYLQSVVTPERARLNYDALLTANVMGSVALGVGFSARWDNDPLPGKDKVDTSTTLTVIYSFDNTPPPPPNPPLPVPCEVPPPPPPPPPAAPPSAASPGTATPAPALTTSAAPTPGAAQ